MNNGTPYNQTLEIVACPICKGKLHYDQHDQELICNFDKLAFPIRNGIPIMLVKEARKLKNTK